MNKDMLYEIWRAIRDIPAWLDKASKSFALSKEQEYFMSDLQSSFSDMNKKHRSSYSRPEVDSEWARKRREEYLSDIVQGVRLSLGQEKIDVARAIKSNDEVSECFGKARISDILKRLEKITKEIGYLSRPSVAGEDNITNEMIDRARNFDLGRLVEAEKGRIRCPFHGGDHNSRTMSISKGFGKCFVCNRHIDAIGWLIMQENIDFISAVKRLQN